MAKCANKTLVQDREMKEMSTEIHLGLHTLTKMYKTTPEFDNQFKQVNCCCFSLDFCFNFEVLASRACSPSRILQPFHM